MNMGNRNKVLDMLELQINCIFYVENDEAEYVILPNLSIEVFGSPYAAVPFDLADLLLGTTKIKHKPRYGEKYCYPDPFEDNGYSVSEWHDDDLDNIIFFRLGVYKTPEEAINRGKMLWGMYGY